MNIRSLAAYILWILPTYDTFENINNVVFWGYSLIYRKKNPCGAINGDFYMSILHEILHLMVPNSPFHKFCPGVLYFYQTKWTVLVSAYAYCLSTPSRILRS